MLPPVFPFAGLSTVLVRIPPSRTKQSRDLFVLNLCKVLELGSTSSKIVTKVKMLPWLSLTETPMFNLLAATVNPSTMIRNTMGEARVLILRLKIERAPGKAGAQ